MHYTFYLFFMFFVFFHFCVFWIFIHLNNYLCLFVFSFLILSLTFFDLSYSIIVNYIKKSIDFFIIFTFVQTLSNLLCRFWVFCCANFECFVVQILSILLCKFWVFRCADFECFVVQILNHCIMSVLNKYFY